MVRIYTFRRLMDACRPAIPYEIRILYTFVIVR
nr:MAG TPA: hypothetical protein [Crassvirales sp.]